MDSSRAFGSSLGSTVSSRSTESSQGRLCQFAWRLNYIVVSVEHAMAATAYCLFIVLTPGGTFGYLL